MQRTSLRPVLAAAVLTAFMFAASSSFAAVANYTATLMGSSEVPPNDTKGTGTVTASYDTTSKKFTYTVTYSGLTGPATAAHFHGPAAAGVNAPPVVPIAATMLASPIKGEATLTDAQAADLAAGKWYFNVHTAAHGPGEIRGQLTTK
jgi:CHRD domain